ncbi:M23 family metallopeptidase [Aquibacillus salsiterrae]|uniref:M23 family metallopeptidase n=1 Tax=Aquibacillus salsiterrae TaxID=2950439 RepID=A0A9X3WI93_9BACI|nr:M23 family metallopeptidase [Aquibacillus salsiterrae]MDC3417874.1 M23 family metallopeptidase [Aquibacillus salsiterrae]
MIKLLPFLVIISFFSVPMMVSAEEKNDDMVENRMALYKKSEALTMIPWYYFAAMDQYERNINKETASDDYISITIPKEKWFGFANPSQSVHSGWIAMFSGIGKDGNGDGLADPTDDEDILYTIGKWISKYGKTEQDFKIAIWNYYHRELSVQTITNIAKVYKKFNTIELNETDFPIPLQYNYSYKNTWGDARGFGGRRIHEGTDIFANYGVPVKATTYGVVELKGWNKFGGWRIGIRDIYGRYHYFAHLNGYQKGIEVGDIVKPGDVIGSVGATGYGPPGTSGKFPPHLHYGIYKDTGTTEWSFDPYPYLKKWERQARKTR